MVGRALRHVRRRSRPAADGPTPSSRAMKESDMQPLRIVTATGSALLMVSLTLLARQAPAPQPQTAGPQQPVEQRQLQTPPMPLLPNNGLGETDQALIPGQPWKIRDLNRPKPVAVVPGRSLG